MQINEVVQKVDLSKRAVKYYEEQGLLTVEKDTNGYRNYSEDNIVTLKKISVYRKLGIGIKDIKKLQDGNNKEILENIYRDKERELEKQNEELNALRIFIQQGDGWPVYTLYFVMHFLRIWIIGRFDLEKNVLHTMSCMVK